MAASIEFIEEVKKKRKPKDRPSTVMLFNYLVTVSHGSFLHVMYHGNDSEKANQIYVGHSGRRRERKGVRRVVKLWRLESANREPL